jgi:hypothetical protein
VTTTRDRVEELRQRYLKLTADISTRGELKPWEDLLLDVHRLPHSTEQQQLQNDVLEAWHARRKIWA